MTQTQTDAVEYRIINIMEGFENPYNDAPWQVLQRDIDSASNWDICGIFYTREAARQYVRDLPTCGGYDAIG